MTNRNHEDDITIVIIALISILITTLIDSIQCLISLSSKSSTPELTNCVTQSSATKPTKSGNMKNQRLSPSTKPRSITVGQRKVDGTTMQDTQSSPIASSPRSKRSKPSSNTSTSTRSKSSQALASQPRTRTTKSISPPNTLRSTPNPNHTIADDKHTDTANRSEHQPTELVSLLPEPQEEVQEHTVLRTKMSRTKLKA